MKALTLLLVASVNTSVGQEPKRPCQPADWPTQLPSLGAVLDSAALLAFVLTLSAGDAAGIEVSILYRHNGLREGRMVTRLSIRSTGLAFLQQSMGRGLRR